MTATLILISAVTRFLVHRVKQEHLGKTTATELLSIASIDNLSNAPMTLTEKP